MKTLFITTGPITWASSRIRAHWPAKYMEGADVVTIEALKDQPYAMNYYDAYIWQKTGDIETMKRMQDNGKLVYIDVCDPIHWFQPAEFLQMVQYCDGVVVPTQTLADDISSACAAHKIHIIPDRLELSHFPKYRIHNDSDPVRFIWFGLHANRHGIVGALAYLERLSCNGYNVALFVCDDRPDQAVMFSDKFPTYMVKWTLEQENEIISSCDIALIPPYPGPWGLLKSNNRKLTATACGLPSTTGNDWSDLLALVRNPELRQSIVDTETAILKKKYDVHQSALDWERLLNDGHV